MASFSTFKTRPGANLGHRLQLLGPDGKPSNEWVQIRGKDSDAYQQALVDMKRDTAIFAEKHGREAFTGADYQAMVMKAAYNMSAALIIDWSFDEPCNPETIHELLKDAPDIANQIEVAAGKRERFASEWPIVSESTPPTNSGSPSPSTESTGNSPSATT